jgi:hypothetical protein
MSLSLELFRFFLLDVDGKNYFRDIGKRCKQNVFDRNETQQVNVFSIGCVCLCVGEIERENGCL